ncbi:ABC transporter substrate-binding protein [Streptomyces blattellae]|uniref:ABC transporter substrate-binding protein n=1 Tax=Streptomyces blattellae TaxID=2569855 RepID=UPI0012B80442|nr:ABC transporter substrate-binding protein [Streptomyces blattellae]
MGHGRTMRAVVAVAIASCVLAACGDDGEPESASPTGDSTCTEGRVGGEVTMGSLSQVTGLDPVVNLGLGGTGANEVIALYDTLVRYDPETDEFVPVVAESLKPDEDFAEWTLKLREGVTFGNGDALTAEQVRDSFARHQDPANRSAAHRESLAVTEMEIVDPLTLVFHLDEPWSRFPTLLADLPGMVTNGSVVERQGENFNTAPTGGGVGPYEVQTFTPGEKLVLKAKDDWWGGPVCIRTLRFVVITGSQATYDAFKNDDIQLAFLRAPDVIAQAEDDGVQGLSTIDNAGSTIILNTAEGPAADPLVRRALAAAMDPEVINQRAYGGAGLPGTALINEQSILYDGLAGPEPDADRAADLVERAKAAGWDGRLKMPCQNSPEGNNVCLAMKAMAEAAGMSVTIEQMAPQDFISTVLVDRSFDIASWSMPLSEAEPAVRLSAAVGTGGGLNPGGYSNAEMDAALAALRAAPDAADRRQALAGIQEIWNETLPSLVIAANENFIAISDAVKGVRLSQNSQIYFDSAYVDD